MFYEVTIQGLTRKVCILGIFEDVKIGGETDFSSRMFKICIKTFSSTVKTWNDSMEMEGYAGKVL